jgi:rRNA maturation RNase YbeY
VPPPIKTKTTASPRFDLAISASTPAAKRLVPLLVRHVRKVRSMLASSLQELSIALVGNPQMSELHHEFLGILGPTDVLTFELDSDSRGRVTSGEIAICVPEARRQAKLRGGKIEHEVLLYAIHGMLHLSGFDDKSDRGFQLMHRREDQILTALGVGPVFGSAPTKKRGSGAD